jgi:hypothetical protein
MFNLFILLAITIAVLWVGNRWANRATAVYLCKLPHATVNRAKTRQDTKTQAWTVSLDTPKKANHYTVIFAPGHPDYIWLDSKLIQLMAWSEGAAMQIVFQLSKDRNADPSDLVNLLRIYDISMEKAPRSAAEVVAA